MRKRIMDWCAVGLLLPFVPACGGSDGATGASGNDGAAALIATADEPAGDNCVDGGTQITYGADANGNGVLDESEIEGTRYVCNGSMGPAGDTGPEGPEGPTGATGATGADGADGADGAPGHTGPTGATGAAGATGPAGADG
ncbi:MAG TPA: hypothetical protein VER11_08620, partial [Polyangiaceae bacterium]|nr:hypothetical protein [Polyangiaceae bacterium]